jgi:hypothetical protein
MARGRTSRRSLLKYEYANIFGRCFCLDLTARHHISALCLIKGCINSLYKKCLIHAVIFFPRTVKWQLPVHHAVRVGDRGVCNKPSGLQDLTCNKP